MTDSPGVTPAVPRLTATAVRPTGFEWGAVESGPVETSASTAAGPPPLGAIADFTDTWVGTGFNTIFRPQAPPRLDNLLELNLTAETLSFSPSLGSIPNRGMVQDDVFMNGIPYLQTINDVTDPAKPVGIHVEPGVWLAVPETTQPRLGATVVRMGSIPHGTTMLMQGIASTAPGAPTIPEVDITPTSGSNKIRFPSQTAADVNVDRIPQDLAPFIEAGTITQAMLDDPNTVLRNAIAGQTIVETTTISITSDPASPLFGGGENNIAFLLADPVADRPNARVTTVSATFWMETVSRPDGTTVKQLQYSQTVLLDFNGVVWPHVSVATLRPLRQPGSRTFQRVASARTDAGTQYVAVGDGRLWHTIGGTSPPEFGLIEAQERNDPGEFTSVAVTGAGDALHVVGIVDGRLWHTMRSGDGTWQDLFGLINTAAPGVFTSVSCLVLPSGDLQVTGVANGNLWSTVRHAGAGTWDPFTDVDG